MTFRSNRDGGTAKRGGRRSVEFVPHPHTGKSVEDLRLHKTSGCYCRIADGKTRRYYPCRGPRGVAYLRRAVFDHLCWMEGREPETTETLIVTKPGHDDFGAEVPTVGSFDENGNPVGVTRINQADLAAYVRGGKKGVEKRGGGEREKGSPISPRAPGNAPRNNSRG